MVKNLPASAGDAGGTDWIPGSGCSQEGEMATHSRILACEMTLTEESGWLQQFMGSQRVGHNLANKQQQLWYMPEFSNKRIKKVYPSHFVRQKSVTANYN